MAVTAGKRLLRAAKAALSGQAPLAGAFSVFMAAAYAPAAQAIDWRFEPRIGATTVFSDNIDQSATDAENGMSLSVTPGFSLTSHGSRRVQAVMQYNLSAVTRFGGKKSDDLYHNLGAAGKAELVEDFLFIDGHANISQQLISLLGSLADASVNDRNRTTVGTYSISPYVLKRLGTFAVAQARYTASGSVFQDNAAADSSVNAFTTSLSSGTRFNDLSWSLGYSIRKANNRNAPTAAYNEDVTLENAYAQAGYALSRQFRVFGTVGRDWNDYLSTSGTSGSSYSVGLGWAPSRRTDFEVSAGERYFGRTFSLAGSHRTRATNWTLRYSENVSDFTQQFLEQSSRIFWMCNGRLVETTPDLNPPSGQAGCQGPITAGQLASDFFNYGVSLADLVAAGLLNVSATNGIYVIKNLTAGVFWNLGRLDMGLSAQDTRRLYQALADAEDHIQSMSASASYRLTPLTTANTSLTLTRNSLDSVLTNAAAREDDYLSLSVGLNRRFNKDLTGTLTFRHTQRDSNDANADYDENSITASANLRF
jgi:uncharacterized protein (PEP-CTERM system associated)